MERVSDVTDTVFYRYLSNAQAILLESDETYRVFTAIQAAGKRLKDERGMNVQVLMHDKLNGFYDGTPPMAAPANKSNLELNALQFMLLDEQGIIAAQPQTKVAAGGIPFLPTDNIIFVLRDWEDVIRKNLLVEQGIRAMIQSNMASDMFFYHEKSKRSSRGKRMFIFLSAVGRAPDNIPELKPHLVPLPDEDTLAGAIDSVLEPLIAANKADKNKGFPKPSDEVRQKLIMSVRGSTYQFVDDTIAFAIARHRGISDIDKVLNTIETERSAYVAGIPGLTYVPKATLTPIDQMAGYEPAIEFIQDCISIDPKEAEKRKLQPLKGITLAGAPGVAKTIFGMATALITNRILLLWSLGESQASHVGESEAITRRVLQLAQAMSAVVLVDDVDKAGVSIASGASSSAIEGGPFGRMIQMLLTEMSSGDNKAIWIFTCNRINNLPPELIRPGRMDERFFVQRPDSKTRESILKIHITKRGYKTDEGQVGLLSDNELTDGWTGAELEDLVKRGVRRAMRLKTPELDYRYLCDTAKGITPMIKQEAYKDDIVKMESFCETWTKIGRSNSATVDQQKADRGRSQRRIET